MSDPTTDPRPGETIKVFDRVYVPIVIDYISDDGWIHGDPDHHRLGDVIQAADVLTQAQIAAIAVARAIVGDFDAMVVYESHREGVGKRLSKTLSYQKLTPDHVRTLDALLERAATGGGA